MPVYLIRAGEHGPVKIGYAEDVPNRMVKMQADNHERLTVLRIFEGGAAEESALHLRFAELRLHGEWHSFSRAMLADLGLVEIRVDDDPPEEPGPIPPPAAANEPLGPVIRAVRLAKGFRQRDLASAVGIARSTLASIEKGHDQPGRRTLFAIAGILGVSVDILCTAEAA